MASDNQLYFFLEQFLSFSRVEKGLANNTIFSYSSDLRIFFSFLDELKVGTIDGVKREHIASFCTKRAGENISAKSMHRALCAIRRYFLFLRKEGKINTSPAEDIELPKVESRLPRTAPLKDIDRVLTKPGYSPRGQRDAAIIAILYAAGLRVTELISLKVGDIDFPRGFCARLAREIKNE
jgi:integrase/recombinase XerD